MKPRYKTLHRNLQKATQAITAHALDNPNDYQEQAITPLILDIIRKASYTEMLQHHQGNQSKAARTSGVSRDTFLKHCKELHITLDKHHYQ